MNHRASLRSSRLPAGGFTLLEVSATMGILLILAGGIFSITSASFELTSELSQFQEQNILKKRFIELCRMNLEEVPGHARVEFKYAERGQFNASYLSIVDHPFAFTFGGNTANVQRVILETDVAAGGYLKASLLYLTQQENLAFEGDSFDPSNVQRRVVLLRRLRELEWRFFDTNRQEWIEPQYWNQPRNPTLISMSLAMENDATPERAVFWIPPEKAVNVGRGRSPRDQENEDADDDAGNEDETEIESPVRAP